MIGDWYIHRNTVWMLTPEQIALVSLKAGVRTIAFPVLTHRSTWDPHLSILCSEITTNLYKVSAVNFPHVYSECSTLTSSDDCGRNKKFFQYNSQLALIEAMSEISDLISEVFA
jgi:hypothetical protein